MNPARQLPVSGVFCASATPVLEDGSPDHAAFAAHCRALIEEGCDGVALLGTTGEANSFSLRQRQDLLEKVIAFGLDPQRLLPGTSQTNVPDSITLVKHAVEAGVKACVVLPPFYYKGVSDEGLFRFYAELIEGVGSNDLRVVLYHIPPIAQIGISLELTARLREAFPGVIVGVKDSSGKIESMEAFAKAFDNFSVLAGADHAAAAARRWRGLHHLELQSHRQAFARGLRQLVRRQSERQGRCRPGPHQRLARSFERLRPASYHQGHAGQAP